MTDIGAEVGQKMRSAIKAKLLELNCYVDDELPDYIMVMVANKRTKSQMKEDLQLFLSNKTATFVDWLHIVLKKLKEVTVTNSDVYKKTAKRKSDEMTPNISLKKEKKEDKKPVLKTEATSTVSAESTVKSLTDDLPVYASKLSEKRKIVVMKENKANNLANNMQDTFDIPLLSEVTMSTEEELQDLEKKIKNVKSRLGLLVESDDDEQEPESPPPVLKVEPPEQSNRRSSKKVEKTPERSSPQRKTERVRITFDDKNGDKDDKKRKSVLDRLGKRTRSREDTKSSSPRKSRTIRKSSEERSTKSRSSSSKAKEGILKRLGVKSKVFIPVKPAVVEEPEQPFKTREVASVIKIKPRNLPPNAVQPNKNLLLKAVAEAQKSIAQTRSRQETKSSSPQKPDALYTKNYKPHKDQRPSKQQQQPSAAATNSEDENSLNMYEEEQMEEEYEYIPTPIVKSPEKEEAPLYVPSSKTKIPEESTRSKLKQQFIVTLDGIQKPKFRDIFMSDGEVGKPSIKSRLDKRRSPSPIVFDMGGSPVKTKSSHIPETLPNVHAPTSVKNKERCKYWPSCRHGEKCEFVHPSGNCEKFPHCNFGDKCLFIHPTCKFGSSCTRRDCTYSHTNLSSSRSATALSTPPGVQTCKFYPNCTNTGCVFYHPKPCRFGKFCKNPADCAFAHNFPVKGNLTWRSK